MVHSIFKLMCGPLYQFTLYRLLLLLWYSTFYLFLNTGNHLAEQIVQ